MSDFSSTLFWLRLVQVLLAVPLLALAGQGIVYVLTRTFGQDPKTNFFYRVLDTVSLPFRWLCRRITPGFVADRHLPLVVLSLLVVGYAWVTLEIGSACARQGLPVGQCLQGR